MKFKRINMIIGKKQLIITGLTLILGVAVYINYIVGSSVSTTPADKDSSEVGNYGDVQFVTDSTAKPNTDILEADNSEKPVANSMEETVEPIIADGSNSEDYFAQARLDREESRAQAVEILQNVYAGGDSTDTELAVLAIDAKKLSNYVESENRIESVLKAQGFEDIICYLSENGANIIVKTSGLQKEQAAQIKNALLAEVKIPSENITIVEIK